MTLSRHQVQELLRSHGLHPSRALGQNFVADPNTVRRIARLAGLTPTHPVLEIGAGLGSLTLALAETGAPVVAVETDRHLVPILRAQVEPLGVHVVEGDAMTLDLEELLETVPVDTPPPWALVANLPYNVAVPLVLRVLDDVPMVGRMLVMVQREVGERIAADAGSAAYGAVSVRVAYYASATVVGRVPASVFVPRPRVESVLVRVDRRTSPAVDPSIVSAERLFAVVRAGFAHRRKMLRRSLDGIVTQACFEEAGIEPTARAEELSVEQWGRLAACSG